MTHEELLARITNDTELEDCWMALRAVVEMHKPKTDQDGELVCSQCLLGQEEKLDDYYFLYPCPTIKRITKELPI